MLDTLKSSRFVVALMLALAIIALPVMVLAQEVAPKFEAPPGGPAWLLYVVLGLNAVFALGWKMLPSGTKTWAFTITTIAVAAASAVFAPAETQEQAFQHFSTVMSAGAGGILLALRDTMVRLKGAPK